MEQEIFQTVMDTKNKMEAVSKEHVTNYLNTHALDDKGKRQMSDQQWNAVEFLTTTKDQFCAVQGLAGTGKTYMLDYARQVFEDNDFVVKGACYTGKAANGLQKDAHIPSTTLHSFLNQLEKEAGNMEPNHDFKSKTSWNLKGIKPAEKREVWIVDEASMVDNVAMHNLMKAAELKEAKVVFVGDNQQLLPVGAGNAFSNLVENKKIGYTTLDEIRRQKDSPELLGAVKEAVLGDVKKTFEVLEKKNNIVTIAEHKDRMKAMVEEFTKLNQADRDATVILTATNRDRKTLNEGVRKELKRSGQLQEGKVFNVVDNYGNTLKREFSVNDKVIFLQNDKKIGVQNGQTGFVEQIKDNTLVIATTKDINSPDRMIIEIELEQYNRIDHGYAMTTHKAQGITENRAIINLDTSQKKLNSRNSFYVDISRARHEVKVFTDDRKMIMDQVKEFDKKLTSDDFNLKSTPRPEHTDFKKYWQDTLEKINASIETFRSRVRATDMSNLPDIGRYLENWNKPQPQQPAITPKDRGVGR
jgi:ATP-dependent exoDNAse (exonuclease V) alpha subunit